MFPFCFLSFYIWFFNIVGCVQSKYNEEPIVNVDELFQKKEEQNLLEKIEEITSLTEQKDIDAYCFKNKEKEIQSLCQRYRQRSHLLDTSHKGKHSNKSTIAGCSSSDIVCVEKQAHKSSTIEQVIEFCSQLEQKRWEHECYFTTAETWVQKSPQKYDLAVSLCKKSGRFFSRCIDHLTSQMVRDEYTIEEAIAISDMIFVYWNGKEHTQKTQVDLFWFEYLEMSRQKHRGISTDLYRKLPEHVHPHITSFVTHSLLYQSEKKSIQIWHDEIVELINKVAWIPFDSKAITQKTSDSQYQNPCTRCTIFFNHRLRETSPILEEDIFWSIKATLQLSDIQKQ